MVDLRQSEKRKRTALGTLGYLLLGTSAAYGARVVIPQAHATTVVCDEPERPEFELESITRLDEQASGVEDVWWPVEVTLVVGEDGRAFLGLNPSPSTLHLRGEGAQ